jgi:hypothetical protein
MPASPFPVLPYIIASLAYFLLADLWYMPLFGKVWSKEVGVASSGESMVGPILGHLVASFVFALSVYFLLRFGRLSGLGAALRITFALGLLFGIANNSGKFLFQRRPKLFFIDAAFNLVAVFVVALILSLWH